MNKLWPQRQRSISWTKWMTGWYSAVLTAKSISQNRTKRSHLKRELTIYQGSLSSLEIFMIKRDMFSGHVNPQIRELPNFLNQIWGNTIKLTRQVFKNVSASSWVYKDSHSQTTTCFYSTSTCVPKHVLRLHLPVITLIMHISVHQCLSQY